MIEIEQAVAATLEYFDLITERSLIFFDKSQIDIAVYK